MQSSPNPKHDSGRTTTSITHILSHVHFVQYHRFQVGSWSPRAQLLMPANSFLGAFGIFSRVLNMSSKSALGFFILPLFVGIPRIGANRLQNTEQVSCLILHDTYGMSLRRQWYYAAQGTSHAVAVHSHLRTASRVFCNTSFSDRRVWAATRWRLLRVLLCSNLTSSSMLPADHDRHLCVSSAMPHSHGM